MCWDIATDLVVWRQYRNITTGIVGTGRALGPTQGNAWSGARLVLLRRDHDGLCGSPICNGAGQGLGIGGLKTKGAQCGGGEHAPWCVARKDMDKNTLWVEQGETAFSLHFMEPQWAVTPEQSAVLYDAEVCLGGGVIAS